MDRIENAVSFPAQLQDQSEENAPIISMTGSTVGLIPPAFSSTPRPQTKRWLMLFLFCASSFLNSFQWIHLNIISDKVEIYFNASLGQSVELRNQAIDWLSMVYMLAYILLIFPANWLLETKGLYLSTCLGAALNCQGAWMKCVSIYGEGNLFWLVMVAQTFCAVAQVFILGVPAYLAAQWFGSDEVSTATAIGVFGNQLGTAAGFILPVMLFNKATSEYALFHKFTIMFYTMAAVSTALSASCMLFFSSKPSVPPSAAQQNIVDELENVSYWDTLKNLMKNIPFVLLVVAYGLNAGSYYALGTLLNPILLNYYKDKETGIGWAGFSLVVSGVGGSILAGMWLDKTKSYRLTNILLYAFSLVALGVTVGIMEARVPFGWVYVLMFLLGFFMTGYLPVGFEFAAEITYPQNIGVACGLLNMSSQIFGIIIIYSMRAIQFKFGFLWANVTLFLFLALGLIITTIVKSKYKRKEAVEQAQLNTQMDHQSAESLDWIGRSTRCLT